MLDLAREYGDEHLLKDILARRTPPSPQSVFDALQPPRATGLFPGLPSSAADVFRVSKVWPTDLGTGPTAAALERTLHALGSTYIDAYLLHWPA